MGRDGSELETWGGGGGVRKWEKRGGGLGGGREGERERE